ncbi:hypothetical protein LX81_00103 [Palleronia aestuarii]|uniref:DUF484 family protein n=1 Tax=Palleronia aestuarii TaxID=568105 RepID=A0A2W7P2J4_9RHOB|nr:DUF484 family protein [Palleronia aestuarii]PZX19646.1 hypothetical protein LX81_00103 [Palleronia aestuarii]
MTSSSTIDTAIRDHLMADPARLLDDPVLMQALVGANDAARGENVIDLRGVAMRRLSERLDRLEETHRSVIAAAYDNITGIKVVHRAVLALLEPSDATSFWALFDGSLARELRVDAVRFFAEADVGASSAPPDGAVATAEPGFCSLYAGPGPGGAPRRVTLRRITTGDRDMHGPDAADMRSEACLLLALGEGAPPAMLVLASRDGEQFAPGQGVDLLEFLAGTVERVARTWLA